ncbi:glycosyltransferase [Halolamina rubra]|uniref:glycosyltransferase n=1 Tax=Halolamina rubra TaxID=1380430 RepID=UPI0009E26EA0|nr:glycosyltransferase [Halolamina rubra]
MQVTYTITLRVCWIKLNGWPDAFNERLEAIATKVDEVVLIKPRNAIASNEPCPPENVEVLNIPPKRKPVLQPRARVLLYPIWIFMAVFVYLKYRVKNHRVDIIHSIDYPFSAIAARILSLLTFTPRVASVRGLPIGQFSNSKGDFDGVRDKVGKNILIFLNSFSLRNADFIITKSEYQQRHIEKMYSVNSEMESIPTGVDYSKFDPNIEDDKDGTLNGIFQNIPEDRVVVLQLGQIVYRKGSDLFAERATSYSGYPCSHFLLVGESQTEEFSKKSKKSAKIWR